MVELLPRERIVVADAAEDAKRYDLPRAFVVPLPNSKEDMATAKVRIGPKNSVVYALYPDTTVFYPGMLVSNPHRNPENGKIFCDVQFHDDEDETGQVPKRKIECHNVFPKNHRE